MIICAYSSVVERGALNTCVAGSIPAMRISLVVLYVMGN